MAALERLPWLREAPSDFRQQCRALDPADATVADKLVALASTSLATSDSSALNKALARLNAEGAALGRFTRVKVGIAPSATFDAVVQMLPAAGLRHGLLIDVIAAEAEQVHQQMLDPASLLNAARPEFIVLAIDHRWFALDRFGEGNGEARVAAAIENLEAVVDGFRERSGATVIVPTLPEPVDNLFGGFDAMVAATPRAMTAAVNQGIREGGRRGAWPVLDVADLAGQVGRDAWFDARLYNMYKIPFALGFASLYTEQLARLVAALRGRARKCLVLDLDNTCWGGAIGDDGLDGIVLGMGTGVGEAFRNVQTMAAELKARGIILAVCSKNDETTARAAFASHPEMVLREGDIAVFQANWADKASNLEAIAETLSIGLDALVFLDDNPVERETVRRALPMVAVPELDAEPSSYVRTLLSAGYFEAATFSAEDRLRAKSYAANAQRAEVKNKARDLGEYLASLSMIFNVAPFDSVSRARVTQLINKTNQFNLTTRRLTEDQVRAIEEDDAAIGLSFRLRDRFGEFGLIGVVTARATNDCGDWVIDDWLMSCRVLGRRVEDAMLSALVEAVRHRRGRTLRGHYLPTAKNHMVRDHYERLGFAIDREDGDGRRDFVLGLATYVEPALPMVKADSQ